MESRDEVGVGVGGGRVGVFISKPRQIRCWSY